MFSSADENLWDGYDSALDDESASEEESTSEDKARAHTGEKAKDVARSRVRAGFYSPDIDAHKQQLHADAVANVTDNTPGCFTPAVARTATNSGRPSSKLQVNSTAASTGQDEEKMPRCPTLCLAHGGGRLRCCPSRTNKWRIQSFWPILARIL